NKELFDKRFPGQFIAEYIAQTRAWFYYMHVMSTLLFDSNSFENVVTTGTIMSDKGEKLSKSKRNFTDPWIIIEQHGMDALRYYLMTSVVMQSENVNFVDREVKEIYNKVLNILWNVVSFYEMFASELVEGNENMVSENVLDKWILAKLHILIEETTTHLDAYNTVKGGRPIKEFIAELSTWYVRRSRERFKGEDEDDKQHALRTLREVLLTLSKVMAPFTPFIAEQIYKKMNGKEESVHLSSWPQVDESLKNPELLAEVEKIRKMVEMGLSLRKDAGVRVRQPLQVCSVGDFSFSDEGLRHMIKSELNVKEVITEDVSGDNWQTKEDAGFTVSLNTDISPELKKEGLVREIVRAVNQIRKEQGFTREHEIIVSYSTEDTMLNEVFIEYAGDIQKSVLAKEIKDGGEKDVTINNALVKLSVEKI
ncbi:MAG: class I tRNA ligase family protein, partial [Candidatus Magasanikbacteria bacterium]|nr:class I tRNA ligase family protein [Candidatus Magasanikbacteria bacterium]